MANRCFFSRELVSRRVVRALAVALAFVLSATLVASLYGQVVEEWVARYDGPSSLGDWSRALALDEVGNIYVTGWSPGREGLYAFDYATVKYAPDGTELWVARYNGPDDAGDEANAIAVDGEGNVYVTGFSSEEVVPGSDWYRSDYITIKYDAAGNELWVKRYDAPTHGDDMAHDIAVDEYGNAYVTGYSPGRHTDYATVKYAPDGTERWVARFDGPTALYFWVEAPPALAVDAAGNVYVTGKQALDWTGCDNYPPGCAARFDYATVKYDTDGNEQWVAYYNGPGDDNDRAIDVAVDGVGNVYVTGNSVGPGTRADYATVKYDTDGNEQWVARYDGPAHGNDGAQNVAVDGAGNVYVSGGSDGTYTDYVVVKYDSQGNELWASRYDGRDHWIDWPYDMALDRAGNVYVTGYTDGASYFGTVKFDTTSGEVVWVAPRRGGTPYALAVDAAGSVYVTGPAWGGSGSVYTTVKYVTPNRPPVAEAGGLYNGNEGSAIALSGATASDPDSDPLNLTWSVDDPVLCSFSDDSTLNPDLTCADNGSFTVTLTADDGTASPVSSDAWVTVNNVDPSIDGLSGPIDPIDINNQSLASVEVTFSDPGTADTHDVTWGWGDAESDAQLTASSPASQGHTYDEARVYPVTVRVTDDDEGSALATFQFIVIYDPEGGFVTGGGWIDSPAGAYAADPSLTGKANFGFVSKYKKGATAPTGNTQFQLKVGNLNFHSSEYDWLVVNQGGTNAQYKGTGTINGEGTYKFMLWAGDGDHAKPAENDTFRIKIWEEDAETEVPVYDNGFDPSIGGGNIVVHK